MIVLINVQFVIYSIKQLYLDILLHPSTVTIQMVYDCLEDLRTSAIFSQ